MALADPGRGGRRQQPETPEFTCTTSAQTRSCSFTHGPGLTGDDGTTTYRAWIDADNNNATVEADATEGPDEAAMAGADAEADDTDVVTKTWTQDVGPPECDDGIDNDEDGFTTSPTTPIAYRARTTARRARARSDLATSSRRG